MRTPTGTSFSRELTSTEAYLVLKQRELPGEIRGLACKLDAEVSRLGVISRVLVPAVLFEDDVSFLRLRIVFRHLSVELLPDFKPASDFDAKRGYAISGTKWFAFDVDALQAILSCLKDTNILVDGLASTINLRQYYEARRALTGRGLPIVPSAAPAKYVSSLESYLEKEPVQIPEKLKLKLYAHQVEGLRWLQFCYHFGLGCLLADDMGLGKTATVISLMAWASIPNLPVLVVCPTTVLANWLRELDRACPSLKVVLHHGSERLVQPDSFLIADVIVTSYGTAREDVALLSQIGWNMVVLDEAQKIKNPESGVSKACRQLKGRCPVAMTGTPFENRPLDLWSLMDFVEPGFLGTRKEFDQQYSDPMRNGDKGAITRLEQSLRLFMLRRLKREVWADLPDKIEIDQPVMMTASEADLYRQVVSEAKKEAQSRGILTNILTPLREICCHPSLKDASWNGDPARSCGKYQRLVSIMEGIIEANEKVIIFTSFLGMLDILESDIPSRFNIPVFRIDGGVPAEKRQPLVDSFSAVHGSAAMLLNPQAAGLGLNIVAATHVIHYNREWNPAVEDQATDRVYRIGQTQRVMVHYMFYVQTVDQIISDRLFEKRDMAGRLVFPSGDKDADRQAVLAALELTPTRVIEESDDEDNK